MIERYDVVVVGGGHNGLTCAGYLAKAGKRVLVLEARDVVGGGCATKEVAAPGFRHNFHSNFHGIIHMGPVYRDLELERYGAEYVWPENQFGHVFPDGRALVCARDLDTTVERIARFSARDAATFRELAHVYQQVLADGMIPAMFSPPAPPSGDLLPLEAMGTDGLGLIRQFLSAPNHVAHDLFESPEVQTWIGFWVAQLAGTGDVFGLGANYPVMVAGSMEPWGWAICKGGSVKLAQAMEAFVRDHGGEIRVERAGRADRRGRGWSTVRHARRRRDHPGRRHLGVEPGSEAHVPRPGRSRLARRDPPTRMRTLAVRRHVDVLRLPGARRAGPVEGGGVRAGGRTMLRRVRLRVPRRPGRQRVGLPAGRAAATARTLHGAPVDLRAVALSPRQGGLFLRADRALRPARRRSRGVERHQGRLRRHGPRHGGGRSWRAGSSPKP